MSTQDKEPFLSRWSRRKLESGKESAEPKRPTPAAAPPAVGATAGKPTPAEPKPGLPPVDSLQGLASEYKDFLRPEVDEKLRQTALKKLFHDPHFNVMDGLDTYIDDYSKPDPIPEAMLKTLEHAKGLLFDDDKNDTEAKPEKPAESQAIARAQEQHEPKVEAPVSPPAPESKT
jgi:hypothetical protein